MIQQQLFLGAICLVALAAAATESGSCPGGYKDGAEATLGSFFYECRSGQLVPKGCLTPDSGRILLTQTFDAKNIRWQCTINSRGFPAMVHKSCVYNGRERQANERWEDGTIVYECKRDREYVNVEAIGCVGGGSRRLNVGDKVVVGDLVYACKLNRAAIPVFKPWGCAGKDGRQYATGDDYVVGDFWHYCMEKPDGTIVSEQIGCVHNGKRLRDGDRVFKDDVIFQCFVRPSGAEMKVIGCATKNVVNGAQIDRRVGCLWQEGDEPFQYTLQCKPDASGKSAVKTVLNCDYSLPRGTYKIELGCYRVIDKIGVACMKGPTVGDVKFVPIPVDDNGQVVNPPPGMRYC